MKKSWRETFPEPRGLRRFADGLGSEFMPELFEGDLMYMPTTLPGLSIGKAQELLQQTDRLIKTLPEVERVFGKIGRARHCHRSSTADYDRNFDSTQTSRPMARRHDD